MANSTLVTPTAKEKSTELQILLVLSLRNQTPRAVELTPELCVHVYVCGAGEKGTHPLTTKKDSHAVIPCMSIG